MENATNCKKRCRLDSEESLEEGKRVRTDEEGGFGSQRNPPADDMADVFKTLEEDIRLPQPSPPLPSPNDPGRSILSELGYLLEASDDELGLPPPTASPGSTSEDGGEAQDPVPVGESEAFGFGQIWGFDDDGISGFYGGGFEFGLQMEEVVGFDGGILDYPDALNGRFDFLWHSESFPAI